MSNPVISIENLSKAYQLGVIGTGTAKGDAQRWWAKLRGKPDPLLKIDETDHSNRQGETLWALKDINFQVQQGDALGIIGRNGAGKSTLLKILSRVTAPTSGLVKTKGRIASLLEVGTGFHPELTGRENIYLNGAIMGMNREDITKKFDEIVDFSGVEKFIDTPVKRYSSGMYVRLAFAVAAHLDSEILIVDEVLSVGDAEFQKKCLGKMEDVSKHQGRTVLFVSHNLGAVKNLCSKGILLEGGVKKIEDEITVVTDRYENPTSIRNEFIPFKFKVEEVDVMVNKISINEENNSLVIPTKPLRIDIELEAEDDIDTVGIAIWISHDDTHGVVFATNTKTVKNIDMKLKKGKNKVSCLIESFNLCSGKYWLGFGVSLLLIKYYYYERELLNFDVSEVILKPGSLPTLPSYGHVYLDHNWIIQN
jgi:lipopolysaccharide transport system ATP-binding protein